MVFLASPDGEANRRSLRAFEATLPEEANVVLVADGVPPPDGGAEHELIRTSAPLGRGAALNIGIRRATASVVVVVEPSVVPIRDVVTPLVETLRDPSVAVCGPVGLVTADLRRFHEIMPADEAIDVAAIQGRLLAFRRADAAARGPVDEGFRSGDLLDVWWSLALRDEGEGRTPRRAVAIPGLGLEGGEPTDRAGAAAADRGRQARRNFYRVLDRFRGRLDLAVPGNR